MSYSDFWEMTLREITSAHRGYVDRQVNEWRRTRWLGCILDGAFGEGRTPAQLMPLPGDGDEIDRKSEIELIKERRQWRTER